MKTKIVRPTSNSRYGLRLYAKVESDTHPDKPHHVVFIRKVGMRRWLCDCENQIFIETARRRNCKHIRAVRRKVEQ